MGLDETTDKISFDGIIYKVGSFGAAQFQQSVSSVVCRESVSCHLRQAVPRIAVQTNRVVTLLLFMLAFVFFITRK